MMRCTSPLLLLQAASACLAAAGATLHADSAIEIASPRLIQLRGRSPPGHLFTAARGEADDINPPQFCLREDREPACRYPPCCCWSTHSTLPDTFEREAAQKCYNPPDSFTYIPDPGEVHDDGNLLSLKLQSVPELVGRRLCCLAAIEDPETFSQHDVRVLAPHLMPPPWEPPERSDPVEIEKAKKKAEEQLTKKIYGELPTAPPAPPEGVYEPRFLRRGMPNLEVKGGGGKGKVSMAPAPASAGGMSPAPASSASGGFGVPEKPPTSPPTPLKPGEEYETAQMEVRPVTSMHAASRKCKSADVREWLLSSAQGPRFP